MNGVQAKCRLCGVNFVKQSQKRARRTDKQPAIKKLINYDKKTMTKIKLKGEKQEFFPITSVSRADLNSRGFNVRCVSDSTMEQLASKMADAYCENGFWIDLDIIAEDLGIKKLPKHKLIIKSLNDAQADCACGWHYVATGERKLGDITKEYKKHL